MARSRTRTVPLNRALSKLGALSRSQATEAVRAGRIRVHGRIVHDPLLPVVPEDARILLDGRPVEADLWRTIAFYKPDGVLTTRRDPLGRRTIYDVLGDVARNLVAVGRLDRATSGLLLLTNDTQLANWITDPANEVPRVYLVTAEGRVTAEDCARLSSGLIDRSETLRAASAKIRKASGRESHLIVELTEGRNREIRRMFAAIDHEVIRLKRVSIGGLQLGDLSPGE
ncbi:MAG TPA: pseudouridine synthase, partial [Vicinamibacterales bacterium]|nr:pseudouridine synthase [Vicinamibacterales bacterium]